jgi:exodeoxyribonuclease-3
MSEVKLLSWNVNGYRAALKKGFGDFLLSSGADVLGLQEVKSSADQLKPADTAFGGYECSWNSAERKGYSGVAAFYRQKPLSVRNGFGEARFDCEGRVITLEYPAFYLLNVYFPNGGQGPERLKYKLEFYDAFLAHIEGLRRDGKAVVFCGDVNTAHNEIDLARPKENSERSGFMPVERAWLDKITGKGWVDTFRAFHPEPEQYTWWDYKTRARERNVGWRLDYFFINKEKAALVKDAFILPDVQGSDHCPIGITLGL